MVRRVAGLARHGASLMTTGATRSRKRHFLAFTPRPPSLLTSDFKHQTSRPYNISIPRRPLRIIIGIVHIPLKRFHSGTTTFIGYLPSSSHKCHGAERQCIFTGRLRTIYELRKSFGAILESLRLYLVCCSKSTDQIVCPALRPLSPTLLPLQDTCRASDR